MSRIAFHIVCFVAALVAAAPSSVRAQDRYEWHGATVGVLSAGAQADAVLDRLVARGASSVMLRVTDAADAAATQVASLAASKGLRLILVQGPDADGTDTAVVYGDGDPDASFVLEQIRVDGLPAAQEALEHLFAERARSTDRPEIAPLAIPTGSVDARWYLMPGPIAVPDADLDASMKTAAAFREAHPAVAGGIHALVQAEPYAFYRAMRHTDGTIDQVVAVTGASGRVRLNVSTWFDNDTILKDVVTGKISIVNYGYVTFAADASGLVLIEEYR